VTGAGLDPTTGTVGRIPLGWQVLLVVDDPDTRLDRWASGLSNPLAGVLAVSARPQTDRVAAAIYADLITAAGCPAEHQLPAKQSRRDPRELAAPWLLTGCRDLVITHAHWLDPETLAPLVTLAAAADARLWLVAQPWPARLRTAVAAWTSPDAPLSWEQFQHAWDTRERPPARTRGGARRSRAWATDPGPVPDCDPIAFRQLCAAAPDVDDRPAAKLLAHGYAVADTEILPGLPDPGAPTNAAKAAAAAHVTSRVAWAALTAATADQAVTIARGIQLRLLTYGWHLHFPAHRIRAAHHAAAACAARAFTVRDPAHGAALALVDAGLPESRLPHITIADTAELVDTSPHLAHPWALRAVSAQLHARRLDLAEPSAPLLPDPDSRHWPYQHARRTGETAGPHRLLGCHVTTRTHKCGFGHLEPTRPPDTFLRRAIGLPAAGPNPPLLALLAQLAATHVPDLDALETTLFLYVAQFAPEAQPIAGLKHFGLARQRLTKLGVIRTGSDGRIRIVGHTCR
jgi:hypothetical protein